MEKDYEERIDPVQGSYIVAGSKGFESITSPVLLDVADEKIEPGAFSTLHNWFSRPCRYVGMIENKAIFYIGRGSSDIFSLGAEYYDVTYVIDKNRIAKCYRPGTLRDSFYKNGKWK